MECSLLLKSRVSCVIRHLGLLQQGSVSLAACSHPLKHLLSARMLLAEHLPGALMESHSEICLLVLRVQEEHRPAQAAISIQVHLGPRGTARVEPIQGYLSQAI